MIGAFRKSPLFAHMTDEDIRQCILCSGSELVSYDKEEILFHQQDPPRKLYILAEGSVAVCTDSISGKRHILATFTQPGELFGEVFLFLNKEEYDNYAQAVTIAKVLEMPKDFLSHGCGKNCGFHAKLIANMLAILAQKAYYLNQKLQIMSGATLREKIIRLLLRHAAPDGTVNLGMNREELADFLNVARPSLSRELMRMQEEGLLRIDKRVICIPDKELLQTDL